MTTQTSNVAEFMVSCLEAEGVEYVFGIPGEENIKFVRAVTASDKIRFILVRHEQAASFMADIYGRLTGKAGVCTATLGPGAINLLLGTADAQTDSSPLVAISAQVGLNRIYKESHQIIDLVAMFRPVTHWAETIYTPAATAEMVRKAFQLAQQERPGATYLAVPQDVEAMPVDATLTPLMPSVTGRSAPEDAAIHQAAELLRNSRFPVILAGHGVARNRASEALTHFAEHYQLPVATTFMGKGVISDRSTQALGVMGFMRHDYENFAFDQADLILSVGYELQEFAPQRMNPDADKKIIHINTFLPDTDQHYVADISIVADITLSLQALGRALGEAPLHSQPATARIRQLRQQELDNGQQDDSFPLKPQRIVADIRAAMGDDDIVLADTGAIKMWVSRLYPAWQPLTCLTSNGLSTMAFSLPGALAARLAFPQRKVLAVMGDGSFMMNSQEIETAVREQIPLVVLVWVDGSYGLIKWKMDMEEGAHDSVDFGNPDFVKYAQSFGARGCLIAEAAQLLPALNRALAEDGVTVIACPVDYRENMALVSKLGELTIAL
ncbi:MULTISPECIES: acetolactate synthase large subunit [Tatumella]|uniref:Acetolactate synthase large subunit n=1 Tax=Tatumella punctata TaxID=399969 RepID=A0ABW1VST6_9GAMM|nr:MULTISPECIES: acetolactate synthase large subunit [unclassified Tatumella]MBS0856027.1 acetolactate synthase large subunit [Tatumella sp. JGM16]MBS0878086.1 acetolactate synthase large subunit [Tatumella sp. JGM82]MBS0890445.1 acetolactate synthase large subunit [Tatumella sp. JGM94]MBS0894666.1 acetolactate synthase large subunit [Tatumella sp. JGM130]MBS0900901.1 acetolactate synthase large subunit [Tatumella sp. JGM100]